MLTILLIATIIQIYAKSRSSPFILVDPEKSIKKHIKDPNRRAVAVAMIKDARRKYKRYQKRMKAYAKVLQLLTSDLSTSKEEFVAIFEAILAGVYHDQEVRVIGRIKGLDFVTEHEFNAMIQESISRRQANKLGNERKWIKIYDAFELSLDKMSNIIREVVADVDKRKKAIAAVHNYRMGMKSLISQMSSWNYRDNKILANYHSTEEEIRQTTHDLNMNRREMYTAFIELYVQLGNSLTEKEWSRASRAMKSLLN